MADSTVLVVDDEPRILSFLAENLRADDYTVLAAESGEEALEVLADTRPDLVLLDVVLPGISGLDLCRRLRAGDGVNDPWDPALPIIMLSAKAESNDRVRGLCMTATGSIFPPATQVPPRCRCGWRHAAGQHAGDHLRHSTWASRSCPTR